MNEPVLILTPVFEVLEDRIDLEIWIALKVAVDGDVTPVADLFRKVCRIENELGFEERVRSVVIRFSAKMP